MSRVAFDKMLVHLDPTSREAILRQVAEYELDMNSPEWVPFVTTMLTLHNVRREGMRASNSVGEAGRQVLEDLRKVLNEISVVVDGEVTRAQDELRKLAQDEYLKRRDELAVELAKMVGNATRMIVENTTKIVQEAVLTEGIQKLEEARSHLRDDLSLARQQVAGVRSSISNVRWFTGKWIFGMVVAGLLIFAVLSAVVSYRIAADTGAQLAALSDQVSSLRPPSTHGERGSGRGH